MMQLAEFKPWFDERFAIFLEEKITEFIAYSDSTAVYDVAIYIKTLATSGKRFRPFMVYVGYSTHGGSNDIFPMLAASELLHLFALVHDDVMDEAGTRHGVATTHTVFGERYKSARIGESLAILQGDLLMAWAYEAAQMMNCAPALEEFYRLVKEVTHGQMMDILFTKSTNETLESIEKKMMLKSGNYTFSRPLLVGACLADANEVDRAFIYDLGVNIGIAFQIQDDLLDVLPSKTTGKSCCTDIKAGQQTIISWYMINQAAPSDREHFLTYFGAAEINKEDESIVADLLDRSGAVAFTKDYAQKYFERARAVIAGSGRPDKEIWESVIALVSSRTA